MVSELREAIVESCWEEEGEDLKVEVEAAPGGRLVLRHTRDDGNARNKTGWK